MPHFGAVLCLAVVVGGCEEREPPPRPPLTGPPIPFASARLPDKMVYLEADGKRCFVYWQDRQGRRSVTRDTLCPRALETGERMLMTGATCQRESARAARTGPVRCTYILRRVDEDLRQGEGDYNLPLEG